jgi:hypothetical protein
MSVASDRLLTCAQAAEWLGTNELSTALESSPPGVGRKLTPCSLLVFSLRLFRLRGRGRGRGP